ncbi:MAG: hypothetical protein HOW73_45085 [Polyangiaceae bacterium]|nr:hypothetical protein [Polyangiaceae bacterium]
MRRLSDLPSPRIAQGGGARIVTLGGGHGQAALLDALGRFDCHITAIVSVADDGGCSGKLREELGMPPPGDIRRCLVSLATFKDEAKHFEDRLRGEHEEGRCVGNLVLAEMTQDLGSLQRAVDWAGALLGCVGRVVPVAERAGVLNVYDLVHGTLAGEAAIERLSAQTMVATVAGPEQASPEAIDAIERADLVFIGPGSFVGSTLAVLTTGNVAAVIARAPGRRVFVQNVRAEQRDGAPSGISIADQERILRDHLVIGSGGESVVLDVLSHAADGIKRTLRDDGSYEYGAPVAAPAGTSHDSTRLADALALFFDLPRRPAREIAIATAEAQAIFERYLASARSRLAQRL